MPPTRITFLPAGISSQDAADASSGPNDARSRISLAAARHPARGGGDADAGHRRGSPRRQHRPGAGLHGRARAGLPAARQDPQDPRGGAGAARGGGGRDQLPEADRGRGLRRRRLRRHPRHLQCARRGEAGQAGGAERPRGKARRGGGQRGDGRRLRGHLRAGTPADGPRRVRHRRRQGRRAGPGGGRGARPRHRRGAGASLRGAADLSRHRGRGGGGGLLPGGDGGARGGGASLPGALERRQPGVLLGASGALGHRASRRHLCLQRPLAGARRPLRARTWRCTSSSPWSRAPRRRGR